MSKPLIVSIPHRLGKEEALRRMKAGFGSVRASYATCSRCTGSVDRRSAGSSGISAMGQAVSGTIDVADDHVRLEVTLPWLLAALAEKIAPLIRKEGTLMLEKK